MNSSKIKEELKSFRQTFKIPRHKIVEKTGISLSSLRCYESGTRSPSAYNWDVLKDFMAKYAINEGEGDEIIAKQKEPEQMSFMMKLAEEKINSQEMEIERLNSVINKQKEVRQQNKVSMPLWNDILFDVRTYQTFDDSTCTNFKSYEMKHYQDFYQRLGYSQSEAEKYWRITQKMMINRRGKSTKEQRALFTDGKAIPNLINFEKTDASVTSVEQVSAHFDYAIKHNVTTQLQIYNACYFRKDGSDLLAVLSVLYNFTDMSSTTKIKFIDQRG